MPEDDLDKFFEDEQTRSMVTDIIMAASGVVIAGSSVANTAINAKAAKGLPDLPSEEKQGH